jgi:tetratricopeptide (TPR) repeat protein
LRQDILTIQDQIYNKLVAALGLRLNSQEMAVGASRPTEDLEAYELYLKGRNALRGQLSKANTEKAMGFFNDAIGQDPQFALAFAGLADAQRRMYDQTKDGQWAQKALGAAQQARDLNENLPEVHLSLGSALIATGRQLEGIVEMKSALELAPNSDEGHRRLASAYFSAGRRKEAIESYTKAIEINPHYWFNYNQLGAAYLRLQDNGNAAAAFRRAIEIEPDIATGHLNLGIALFQQGKWNECIAAFQKAIAIQPTFRACSNLGTAFFFLGRYRDAADMFEKAVAMNENSYETVGNLADAYRALGEHPRAKTAYDRAIALALEANRVDSRNATTLSSLALYYAKTDNASQASNFIRRARQISPDDPYISYAEAVIHMLAGLKANALASLGEAFQKGYTVGEAQNDPELKTLRADPEFEKLVQSLRKKS